MAIRGEKTGRTDNAGLTESNSAQRSRARGRRFKWLWAVLMLAPLELGAKGCDSAVVGNDCARDADGNVPAECPQPEPGKKTCGGLIGAACGVGEYCNYPVSAQCGAADQTGTCAPLPTGCDKIYDPVCGCDDNTYSNACMAAAAGVSVAHGSACKQEPSPDRTCGGLLGQSCEAGEFCAYSVEASCGAADQTGVCRKLPEACDLIYAPVCGCDGKTYGNECEANAAGISPASQGECQTDPGLGYCGGLTGTACGKGEFCNFPPDAACGAGDQTGKCAPIPSDCRDNYQPVCGCDGRTYGNACDANAAGVSIAKEGECVSEAKICGGLRGSQCDKGSFCSYAPDAGCGFADQTGVCRPLPEVCTTDDNPVCGCDGRTYSNECIANRAGVSVAKVGECGAQGEPDRVCGGLLGTACERGEFCDFPIEAMCGAADQTGVCRPMNVTCDAILEPVCGCDDKTYSSACAAGQAGVSVAAKGECKSEQPPTGKVCGGLIGAACAKGEYCNYPADALCGRADATGVCTAIPNGCTKDLRPVCGCDGKTYSNPCTAAAAGVSVEYSGECKTSSGGNACGSRGLPACASDEFCSFPERAMCGAADAPGVCAPRPEVCIQIDDPVCGCDGKTYSNSCIANSAGVSVASAGECAGG